MPIQTKTADERRAESIRRWLEHAGFWGNDGIKCTPYRTWDLYMEYNRWARREGIRPINHDTFTANVCAMMGVVVKGPCFQAPEEEGGRGYYAKKFIETFGMF